MSSTLSDNTSASPCDFALCPHTEWGQWLQEHDIVQWQSLLICIVCVMVIWAKVSELKIITMLWKIVYTIVSSIIGALLPSFWNLIILSIFLGFVFICMWAIVTAQPFMELFAKLSAHWYHHLTQIWNLTQPMVVQQNYKLVPTEADVGFGDWIRSMFLGLIPSKGSNKYDL